MNRIAFKVSRRPAGWRLALSLLAFNSLHVCAMAAGREDGLPQRNLLVEWRTSGQGQGQRSNLGVRTGQIIVDSRGNVTGRTSIGTEVYETERQSDSVQQVQVLNGGKARLFVGKTQPYTVWQWAWTGGAQASAGSMGGSTGASTGGTGGLGVIGPQTGAASQPANNGYGNGAQILAQTVWIDLGQGLNVRPRWAGGQAPVIVELEAQARQPSQAGGMYTGQIEPDGQTRRIEVASTLSVPLGQWAVVARSGGSVQRRQSGSLSTRELDESQTEQLEIRVTAP